jgi:hypothetical protein
MRELAEEKAPQPRPQDEKVMAREGRVFWNANGSDGGEIIIFRFRFYYSRCDVCRLFPEWEK